MIPKLIKLEIEMKITPNPRHKETTEKKIEDFIDNIFEFINAKLEEANNSKDKFVIIKREIT